MLWHKLLKLRGQATGDIWSYGVFVGPSVAKISGTEMTNHTHTDACYDLATDVLICGQSTPHDRYQTRSILDIALQVHMTTTGSYERSENEQKDDLRFLRMRLQTWEKSLPTTSVSFDEAVRNLVRIAVQEAEGTLL